MIANHLPATGNQESWSLESKNGTDYYQNDAGALYHIEEQRNLERADMYRFAAYHFMGVKQWGTGMTDVILASGDVYAGQKTIETASGTYTPLVIDFSERDGVKRLREIREAVHAGTFDNWLELVVLPLYGKEKGRGRSKLAEDVIQFETELLNSEKISARLLAATLILANKLIDKERLKEMWEDIKMLDIIEIAREKGIEEGKSIGIAKGESVGIAKGRSMGVKEATHEMLLDLLIEKFSFVPARVSRQIRKMEYMDGLKSLLRQVLKCTDMEAFEAVLRRMSEDDTFAVED